MPTLSNAWRVVETFDHTRHVIPTDDLKSHQPTAECWCKPFDPFGDADTLVHNAMDKREEFEQGRLKS